MSVTSYALSFLAFLFFFFIIKIFSNDFRKEDLAVDLFSSIIKAGFSWVALYCYTQLNPLDPETKGGEIALYVFNFVAMWIGMVLSFKFIDFVRYNRQNQEIEKLESDLKCKKEDTEKTLENQKNEFEKTLRNQEREFAERDQKAFDAQLRTKAEAELEGMVKAEVASRDSAAYNAALELKLRAEFDAAVDAKLTQEFKSQRDAAVAEAVKEAVDKFNSTTKSTRKFWVGLPGAENSFGVEARPGQILAISYSVKIYKNGDEWKLCLAHWSNEQPAEFIDVKEVLFNEKRWHQIKGAYKIMLSSNRIILGPVIN